MIRWLLPAGALALAIHLYQSSDPDLLGAAWPAMNLTLSLALACLARTRKRPGE